MANIITGIRIVCSFALLFFSALSIPFFVIYLIAGFSDMIDGSIARKLGTDSKLGERLDSIADMVFVTVAAIKLLPILDVPKGIIIWIGIIAFIKVINIAFGLIKLDQFITVHSIANKVTGALLFALPLTIEIVPLQYSICLVCLIATFAAIQEGHIIRTNFHQMQ